MGAALAVALSFTACSQDESEMDQLVINNGEATVEGPQQYTMHFNCAAPGYDDERTRATTTWADGSTIYLRFGNVAGTAVYSAASDSWTVTTSGTLSVTSSETNCEAYYFEAPGSVSGATVTLKETTAIYQGTGKYTHPTSTDIYVNATLSPVTWRLRFEGGAVALLGSRSDISYYNSFNRSTGQFTTSKMSDVDLLSSEYVYGIWSKTGDNTIYVQTDQVYYRTVKSSDLLPKASAYLTAPNAANYESKKWVPDPVDYNATIEPDVFVAFSSGMVTSWTLGSTVNTFDYTIFRNKGEETYSDDELAAEIYDDGNGYALMYADYLFSSISEEWYEPGVEYCLCAVAKNSEGIRGPVLRYKFTTLSTSLPYAEISNVQATSTTKWTFNVALKNNATGYYLATNTSEDTYNSNWYWYAYNVYNWATTGQIEIRDWTSVQTTLSSGTCNVITVCTWGTDASGNIGNCNVVTSSVAASSRQNYSAAKSSEGLMKEIMPKAKMNEALENTVVYKVR